MSKFKHGDKVAISSDARIAPAWAKGESGEIDGEGFHIPSPPTDVTKGEGGEASEFGEGLYACNVWLTRKDIKVTIAESELIPVDR